MDASNPADMKAPKNGVPPSKGFLYNLNRAVNGTLERAFDALGRFIARRPFVVIAATLVVALALGSGILRLENEDRYSFNACIS